MTINLATNGKAWQYKSRSSSRACVLVRERPGVTKGGPTPREPDLFGEIRQGPEGANELECCRSSAVEHLIGNEEVSGSIPDDSTTLSTNLTLEPIQVARFWSKVAVRDPGRCWLWTASRNRDGYGQFKPSSRHKPLRAHRVAFAQFNGEPPAGALVLHSCGNRACCNPNHLRLGDQADNHRDRERHGRSRRSARGSWRKVA